jgi:hypothetical protein
VRLTFLILSFFLVYSFTTKGQLINNNLGKAFEEQPFFNAKEIKQKKIKEIRCTFYEKKTGDIMRNLNKKSNYYFNDKGYLINVFEIEGLGKKADTTYYEYKYSPKGLLKLFRKSNKSNFSSTIYSYDTIGHIIKEELYHDILLNKNLLNPYFKQDSLIDYETMRYKSYTNQLKKIVYNSYGTPYLDIITFTNPEGQIIEIDKKMKMTSEINETKYYYNSINQLDSLVKFSSLNPIETESRNFKYDDKKNITSKKSYTSKKLIYNTEYLYNKKTGVLSSIIQQEVATNLLSITRFETIYYD